MIVSVVPGITVTLKVSYMTTLRNSTEDVMTMYYLSIYLYITLLHRYKYMITIQYVQYVYNEIIRISFIF